jgi:hypothetical protein
MKPKEKRIKEIIEPLGNLMKAWYTPPQEAEEWEKVIEKYWNTPKEYGNTMNSTKDFIRSLLQEQKEKVIAFVQENREGTFTDEAGYACWYIDELVKQLKEVI